MITQNVIDRAGRKRERESDTISLKLYYECKDVNVNRLWPLIRKIINKQLKKKQQTSVLPIREIKTVSTLESAGLAIVLLPAWPGSSYWNKVLPQSEHQVIDSRKVTLCCKKNKKSRFILFTPFLIPYLKCHTFVQVHAVHNHTLSCSGLKLREWRCLVTQDMLWLQQQDRY